MAVPLVALGYASTVGSLRSLFYVRVMAGALWTGINLFMGFVLGPVIGGLDPEERAGLFTRLTPKMTFFMPIIAMVTITAGANLVRRIGYFSFSDT